MVTQIENDNKQIPNSRNNLRLRGEAIALQIGPRDGRSGEGRQPSEGQATSAKFWRLRPVLIKYVLYKTEHCFYS